MVEYYYTLHSHRGTITANQHTAHTNGLTIGSTANEACDIVTNGTSNIRMRVTNNGNIGLGTLVQVTVFTSIRIRTISL